MHVCKAGGQLRVYPLIILDDILAVVDAEEAKRLRARLEQLFGIVQFEEEDKLLYLGMDVHIEDHGTTIDMQFYVQQLLEGEKIEELDAPGMKNTFIVASKSEPLVEEMRKVLHSKTEKLLYLAKRARPDILTIVTFLCTRVQGATEEDRGKLQRILGYLKCTKECTRVL